MRKYKIVKCVDGFGREWFQVWTKLWFWFSPIYIERYGCVEFANKDLAEDWIVRKIQEHLRYTKGREREVVDEIEYP